MIKRVRHRSSKPTYWCLRKCTRSKIVLLTCQANLPGERLCTYLIQTQWRRGLNTYWMEGQILTKTENSLNLNLWWWSAHLELSVKTLMCRVDRPRLDRCREGRFLFRTISYQMNRAQLKNVRLPKSLGSLREMGTILQVKTYTKIVTLLHSQLATRRKWPLITGGLQLARILMKNLEETTSPWIPPLTSQIQALTI